MPCLRIGLLRSPPMTATQTSLVPYAPSRGWWAYWKAGPHCSFLQQLAILMEGWAWILMYVCAYTSIYTYINTHRTCPPLLVALPFFANSTFQLFGSQKKMLPLYCIYCPTKANGKKANSGCRGWHTEAEHKWMLKHTGKRMQLGSLARKWGPDLVLRQEWWWDKGPCDLLVSSSASHTLYYTLTLPERKQKGEGEKNRTQKAKQQKHPHDKYSATQNELD